MALQLTVITETSDSMYYVTVEADQNTDDIKAVLEIETTIPMHEQTLFLNGAPLALTTIAASGIKDGDVLLLRRVAPRPQQQAHFNPRDPRSIYGAVRSDPALMATLRQNNPELAEAASQPTADAFVRMFEEQRIEKEKREEAEMLRRSRMALDPLDPAAQAEIEKEIHHTLVNENMETAMEYNPEVFGSVHMLYVACELNGRPLKAFVDSGAQMTIMSMSIARECGLLHLVDRRWQGVAKGVGTSKILGRVHSAPMKIGGIFLQVSLTVLEDDSMEFLFGLDNLKRHQCCIDLKSNLLRLNDDAQTAVPFLSEHELPKKFEEMEVDTPVETEAASASTFPPTTNPSTSASVPAPAPAPAPVPSLGSVASGGPAPASVDEGKIERLVALGFSRREVVDALTVASGNEDLAAGILFGM